MKLEDCTKEELIWLIQRRGSPIAQDFEFDILSRRDEENQKAASAAFERASNALGEYCDIIRPYEGKPLSFMPDAVINKATAKIKIRETALKEYAKLEKQYHAIQNRKDEILRKESASDA